MARDCGVRVRAAAGWDCGWGWGCGWEGSGWRLLALGQENHEVVVVLVVADGEEDDGGGVGGDVDVVGDALLVLLLLAVGDESWSGLTSWRNMFRNTATSRSSVSAGVVVCGEGGAGG